MRPVPVAAALQFGVFTTEQALAAGWTMHALRHAVAIGRLERLRPGAYALPRDDRAARLRAAAAAFSLTYPGVPVSHSAAGAVFGLPLLRVPEHVCATYPRGRRGLMPGVHRHRGRLPLADTGRLRCVRLTSPARTVLDIGHEMGADAAIVAADSALRTRLATTATLLAASETVESWPSIAPARRAVALADGAAESPLESISRLRLAAAGLPVPRLQPNLYDLRGAFLGRPDFYWDEVGVVGEADGLAKYDGRTESLAAEKRRQAGFERAGLIVVRWLWTDLADFAVVEAELRDAFARGRRPDRAPRRWRVRSWPHPGAVM